MRRSGSFHPLCLVFAALILLTVALAVYPTARVVAQSGGVETIVSRVRAQDEVKEAWERAREAGSYRFTADVVQTTIPLPTVGNIGRTSLRDALYLEGETNLSDRTMQMTLWSQGGSVLHAETGVEMRVEGDRAFVRSGIGGDGPEAWEEVEDFAGGVFGSGSDLTAFLAAAKDVTNQGVETRPLPAPAGGGEATGAEITFTRYTFRVDGPSYATYVRDQLEQYMAERGELPPGLRLDVSRQYAEMTGEGELWIGSDGLPLRQIIRLEFPPRPDDHRIEAEITIDFSDYAQPKAEAGGEAETASFEGLTAPAGDNPGQTIRQAALLGSMVMLIGLLTFNGRSRRLYAVLAILLIVSMVLTPLLQSVQAAAFAERHAAPLSEEAQPTELRPADGTASGPSTMDEEAPSLDSLPSSGARPSMAIQPSEPGSKADISPYLSRLSVLQGTPDTTIDSDQDGLTDHQESLLGTNPESWDTDGDLITDTLEVQGFADGGQTWYSDPLQVDSNGDGIDDFRECPDPPACLNTDGADEPDLFDRDNDNDLVPDDLDLSPFARSSTTFDDAAPLSLLLNDLTPNMLTDVEFQLRPVNSDHLWYAFNVLDWPRGDVKGQVTDADGATFFTADPGLPRSPDDNGDLKLVPMLEIRIAGANDNLPSEEELEPYGIFVQPLQADGSEKAVYVPLYLVTDEVGQARVAFTGKMLYRPDLAWGNAQEVRLAWAVRALVDVCLEYEDGRCVDYDYNRPQMVHTYYDEWSLTGLDVRENHGTEVALVYEDPAVDDDLHDDGALVALSHGLGGSFLAGRDANGDGQRDITVAEIYNRFDSATNDSVPAEQRWNVPDVLGVATRAYDHPDLAQVGVMMTETQVILESVFTAAWSSADPVMPTLMVAREERFRATNLDVQHQGETVHWDGNILRLDLPGSGPDGVPVTALAGVTWTPYCYNGVWTECSVDTYWDELSRRYPFEAEADEVTVAGLQLGARMYNLSLLMGAMGLVQLGDDTAEAKSARSDATLAGTIAAALGDAVGPTKAAEALVKAIFNNSLQGAYPGAMSTFWADLGAYAQAAGLAAGGTLASPGQWPTQQAAEFGWLAWEGDAAWDATFANAAATIGSLKGELGLSTGGGGTGEAVAGIVWKSANLVFAGFKLYRKFFPASPPTSRIGQLAAKASSAFKKVGAALKVIGVVVDLAMIWGPFVYQVASGELEFGSPAFNMALAYAIAQTMILILFLALNATVVGALIVAVFELVDLLLELLLGFSVRGWMTEMLAKAIFSYEVITDFEIDMGSFDTRLVDPERGMAAGNVLVGSTRVDTTARHIGPEDWKVWTWRGEFYTTSNLRSTTVKHTLTTAERTVTASRSQMRSRWHRTSSGKMVASATVSARTRLHAGLNQSLFYLNTGYALPAVECWFVFLVLYCGDETFSDHTSTDLEVVFDVFPASLDGFYELRETANKSYKLNWDPRFRTLMDADGDGLLSRAHKGPDPDDGNPDIDGDGLPDGYELGLRQAGIPADPANPDVDGDGLSDAEEARLGTNLASKDTDNDGLTDKEEVDGWSFLEGAAGILSHVTSDPLKRDTDGDGMSDLAEYTLQMSDPGEYPFHPRVWNPSPLGLYTELGDEDGFVHPGQTFAYTATVQNNFSTPLYAHGNLMVSYPDVLNVIRHADVNGPVHAVEVSGDNVYVGGEFSEAGGGPAANVARWDRTSDTWSPLGDGVDGPVHAITASGEDVYVGGEFSQAGGAPNTAYIARWNGSVWASLGNGLVSDLVSTQVRAIAVSGDEVFVGGYGLVFGDPIAYFGAVVRWSQTSGDWKWLSGYLDSATVWALAVSGDDVYVGGSHGEFGRYIGRWDRGTETFYPMESGGSSGWLSSDVYAIAVREDQVYAGGRFIFAGGVAVNRVAVWDGENWSGLGGGVNNTVRGLAVNAIGDLYAGGDFTQAGGQDAPHVARWNGVDWAPLDGGVDGSAHAITVDGTQVYVGGSFPGAGDGDNLAGWNDLLVDWAWPDQLPFTLAQGEAASTSRQLTAASDAATQVAPIENAQRSQFNAAGYAGPWDWEGRRESSLALEAGQRPWYTAISPLPDGEAYRMAVLLGDVSEAGYALRFDGVNDYVAADSVVDGLGSGAISFGGWVQPERASRFQEGLFGFFSSAGANLNAIFYHPDEDKFAYHDVNIGYQKSENFFTPNQWYHVLVTIDGAGQGVLYVNGIPEATFTTTVRPAAGGRFSIGQDWDYSVTSDHFLGLVDEVLVWNVARTESQIQADMDGTLTGAEEGLVGYWRFDEGAGETAFDATANHYDGTLLGPTWEPSTYPVLDTGRIAVYTLDEDSFSGGPVFVDDGAYAKHAAPPDIACNENDECLVVWSEQHGDVREVYGSVVAPDLSAGIPFTITSQQDHPTCATITFRTLHCDYEADGQDAHAEVVIRLHGEQVWLGEGIDAGEDHAVGASRDLCGDSTVELWERDVDNPDDFIASWSISSESPGVYAQVIDGGGLGGVVTYTVSAPVDYATRPAVASDGTDFLVAWEGPTADAGHSLRLDGEDDYVNLGNPALPAGTSPRTLCAWAQPDDIDVSGYRFIAAYGSPATSQAMFIGRRGDTLVGGGYGNDLNVPAFWETGSWHHVCLTYDGTTARLYADGAERASGAKSWNLVRNKAYIGRQVNGIEYWDGRVDEVTIWDKALTPAEVRTHMHRRPEPENEANLVAYWRFDEGSGGTADDQTASQYDGTLLNGTEWDEVDALGQQPVRAVLRTGELSDQGLWSYRSAGLVHPDLAWAGDRYVAVWESPPNGGDVWTADFDADGAPESGNARPVACSVANETWPQVAYNPDSGETLVVYRYGADRVYGRLVEGHDVSNAFIVGAPSTGSQLDYPRAAYDPVHASWLTAWSARTGDGRPAVDNQALRGDEAGPALSLDGVDDYVAADSVIDDLDSGAISFGGWVRPGRESASQEGLFGFHTSTGGNLNLLFYLANEDKFAYHDGTYQKSETSFAPNQWYHVMVTIDATDQGVLYVNGVAEATFVTTVRPAAGGRFSIGQEWDPDGTSDHFLGLIDEVRVWNVARTEAQIRADMERTLTGAEPGLVGYWRLDEGTGTVAYDRAGDGNNGTLINGPTWTTDHAPFQYAVERAGVRQTYTWQADLSPQGISLACTAPLGPRALWLRLEEAPGATSFADDSFNGNVGRCSGPSCPDSGLIGRVGGAARFDGEYTYVTADSVVSSLGGGAITFGGWVNPASRDGGQEALLSFHTATGGNRNILFYHPNDDRFSYFDDSPTVGYVPSEHTFAPNQWYHVLATIDEQDHGTLYVNGVQEAVFTTTVRPVADGRFSVGQEWDSSNHTDHFGGLIDEVLVFDGALSPDRVGELYEGSDNAACALTANDAAAAGETLYYDRLNLLWPTRWLGVIESPEPVVVPVTIDADPPTSTITSLTDGQYLQYHPDRDRLIIGGEAGDATSGVDFVEIEVDGSGQWQRGEGAESWAWEWQIPFTEGPHTLRTRATDAVGNLFTETTFITVIVDSTFPEVTSGIVNQTIIPPQLDAAGRWVISLHGSVYDPPSGTAPGSGVESVEVLLIGQEAGVAGNGWQTATVTGGDWAIDYLLPLVNNEKDTMPDPTGKYIFVARATDNVGNQTPSGWFAGIDIRVDAAAPLIALTDTGPSTTTITQTVTLHGVVSDTVGDHTTARGLAGLDIAFVPADADLNLGNWEAQYYDTLDLSGDVVVWRDDPAIDFDWGYGSPDPALPPGMFAARWEQDVAFRVAGTYRFETFNDNGIRVMVDDSPVLDEWADGRAAAHITDTYISAGTHALRVEYYHQSPLVIGGIPVSQPALARLSISLVEMDPGWAEVALDQWGPGVITSTWGHPVPSGLDGVYWIALRGRDLFDNHTEQAAWDLWGGEIDTRGPEVSIDVELRGNPGNPSARTLYTCRAQDFNLIEEGWVCPCSGPPEAGYYDSDWWRGWINDTTRLYELSSSCVVPGYHYEERTVQACDRYGRCSQDTTAPVLLREETGITADPPQAFIYTPTNWTLLTTADPVSIEGAAVSQYDLETLTVTVNSRVIYTTTWEPGQTDVAWATTWTPALPDDEGPCTLLALASDVGPLAPAASYPITVVVDTLPPQITVPSAVLTQAHRLSYGRVALTGPYTEAGGVGAIQVQAAGGGWFDAAPVDDPESGWVQTWRYAWNLGEEPDGQTYDVTAVITDVAGRRAQSSNWVTVDLVPPDPVTATLAYVADGSELAELIPEQTIREVLYPTLVITWTASASADVSRYYAGWTESETPDLADLSIYGLGAGRHDQAVGDNQVLYAHLVAVDVHGNRRWHTLGPVYTDIPTTPDLIADLTYHGWMESGCSQIGADRELARNAYTGQALTGVQRFYVTWNADALRLAWTGADWAGDGDLFVYLDTVEAGGTPVAYNPYPATPDTIVTLPEEDGYQLAADYLVWVSDADTFALMSWNGSDWEFVPSPLPAEYYQLDTTESPATTDLYLPFDRLGITDPSSASLHLVALASEEEALRLWATMPDKNPHSSELAVNTPGVIEASQSLTLTHGYEWVSLGSGLCPAEGQFTDSDLLLDVTADPPGLEVGYLEHDLFYLTPGAPLDGDLDGEPDVDLPVDTSSTLVGHGQVITYSIHYANQGTQVAPGVLVTTTARGAISLASNPLVVVLGDVAPGEQSVLSFVGTVDTALNDTSLEIDVVVADAVQGPYDWLWIQHDVDTAAPESLEIVAPLAYLRPFANTVRGTVYDPSGVPDITLQANSVPPGVPTTIPCSDSTPDDGRWTCVWNVGDVSSGDQFTLRVRAADRFGNTGEWTDPVMLTVDALPPTVTIDAAAEAALLTTVLGPADTLNLTGEVQDDLQASAAEICFEEAHGQYCEEIRVYPGDDITGTWSYQLGAVSGLDNEPRSFSLHGVDRAGNRSVVPVIRSYRVDTVPPLVTISLWVHTLESPIPTLVLAGTATDGSGVSEIYVRAETPQGGISWDVVARDGDSWSYTLVPEERGVYTLWVRAQDPLENISWYGSYEVLVSPERVYLPLILRGH